MQPGSKKRLSLGAALFIYCLSGFAPEAEAQALPGAVSSAAGIATIASAH